MPMQEGIRRLYTGDFNQMKQEHQPDGSIIITLIQDDDSKIYRFKVKDLYGENEEVSKHEVIESKPRKYLLDRMKKAKKEKEELADG